MVFENHSGVPQLLKSFGEDRLGEDHRRCGAISYLVIGLHRDPSKPDTNSHGRHVATFPGRDGIAQATTSQQPNRYRRPFESAPHRIAIISKMRDCVVELVGLELTTR